MQVRGGDVLEREGVVVASPVVQPNGFCTAVRVFAWVAAMQRVSVSVQTRGKGERGRR